MSDIDQLITALYGGGPQKGPVKLSDMTREEKNRYQREQYRKRKEKSKGDTNVDTSNYGQVRLKDMTREQYNEYQRVLHKKRNKPTKETKKQPGEVNLKDMTREEKNRYQRERYKARVKEPTNKPYGHVNIGDMTKDEYNEYQRRKYRERNNPYRTDDIDIADLDEEMLQKIIDETSPPQKKKRTDDEIFEDLRQALMEDTPEKQYDQQLPPRTGILRISDITDI